MADMRKCGIIGTGNVGAASAYTLAVSGLFSEVLLLDADMHRAEGEAADIAHGAALRRPCRVHAGGYADFADCGLVILASAPARLGRLCSGETVPSCKAFWNS